RTMEKSHIFYNDVHPVDGDYDSDEYNCAEYDYDGESYGDDEIDDGGEADAVTGRDEPIVADDKIADLLYDIVSRMGFVDADIEWEEWPDHVRYFVEGKDLGVLIGRHGSTLEALQYIVGVINSHQHLVDHMIIVDIEGYRERREVGLRRLAMSAAMQAYKTQQNTGLPPMTSSDRRIIHMSLKNNPHVETMSVGEEPERKVIVIPRG
ncbi:KH domain-containing protein, partial [bacterium]|nr:KH domain-containing protein [bacterium]